MKILFIANARMPTEKAHGIQIAKMCEAFAGAGADVELVVPRRFNKIKSNIFSYYDVKKNFLVRKLPCVDLIPFSPLLGAVAYALEIHTFAKFVWWHVVLRHRKDRPLVYGRDLWAIGFLPSRCKKIYEAHRLPKNPGWFFRRLISRVDAFVTITEGLKDDLVKMGVSPNDIFVAPDAVDLAMFDIRDRQEDCRNELHLPTDRQIVMYTGHLYDWKGAETLLDAASMCPEKLFVFVGGTENDAKKFEKAISDKAIKNVLLVKHTAHRNIPKYLKAADLLVLPNSATEVISSRYTSPLKLFEYMAARRPIVASDLPSIREILNESTATFFTPDNGHSLTNALNMVFMHAEESAQKADRAFELVKEYTWHKRAERILNFLKS